jgi:hypothetical protein
MTIAADDEAFVLARELLEELEYDRLTAGQAVMKTVRLARLLGDSTQTTWLNYESSGYPNDPKADPFITATYRWVDVEKRQAYWSGAAQIDALAGAVEQQLTGLRVPDVSGELAALTIREVRENRTAIANQLAQLNIVVAAIKANAHTVVLGWYHELLFAQRQADLFATVRSEVDALLAPLAGGPLDKIESIYRRLDDGDPEAVAQALVTCRRLIDAVADALYPPSESPIVVDGEERNVDASHTQNRLHAYVAVRIPSSTRRARLRRSLSDLYDRVSAGVHAEVSIAEARFLFLATYIYLGEVLTLAE